MTKDATSTIVSKGDITYEKLGRSIFDLVEEPTIAMYDPEHDSRDLKTFFYDRLIKMMNPLTGSLNYQEEIALVRGKLQTLFGDPNNRGDDYKNSFEYTIKASIDGRPVYFIIADRKAIEIVFYWEYTTSTPNDRKEVERTIWELIESAELSEFEDAFSYDEAKGCKYGCTDGRPWAEAIPYE